MALITVRAHMGLGGSAVRGNHWWGGGAWTRVRLVRMQVLLLAVGLPEDMYRRPPGAGVDCAQVHLGVGDLESAVGLVP